MDASEIRRAYFAGADATVREAASPATAAAWDSPSRLELMTVGDLTAHLARSVHLVETFLDAEEPLPGDEIDASVYYGVIPDLSDIGSDVNAGVRERSRQGAAAGADAVAADVGACRDRLAARLPLTPAARRVTAFGGRTMTVTQYLRTRCVEFAVHLDDLGAAVPPPTAAVAVGVLVGTARFRHGDLAVLRALSRRERDDVAALRVL